MIKIGFDAKRAFMNNTGLGNYSRSVIESLSEHFPANEYFLYTPKAGKNNRTASLFDSSNITIRTPELPVLKSLWRSRGILNTLTKDQIDIYHGLSHELPIGINKTAIKSVVTIHDLIFLRYPEYYKRIDREIYNLKFRHACRVADVIIAISEQTKKDITEYYNIDPAKIKVVYQSCSPIFSGSYNDLQLKKVREKYNLPENYILNVGTIESRKNALLIIEALKSLPSEFNLVIAGKKTSYYDQTVEPYIRQNNLQNRVHIKSDITFEDLPAVYRQAETFVYPSFFEGFGIPILEALHSGVPVIAAKGSCLEEAGGPHSIYIDPNDVTALRDSIMAVCNDKPLQAKMKTEGKKYALRFSEEIHSGNIMAIYESLLEKNH